MLVSARVVGEMVAIDIEDTGRGISADDLPHIFDKFYRVRSAELEVQDDPSVSPGIAAPGVGLGPYLAKHIIEQLGGRITVESEVGTGTCFTLYLPAYVSGSNSEMTIEDDENVEAIAISGR